MFYICFSIVEEVSKDKDSSIFEIQFDPQILVLFERTN